MTIAITGANGQLGSELCRQYGTNCIPLNFPDFDLTKPDSIREALARIRPVAVINTAAYTAVDKAEEDSTICHQVNADAVQVLADVCRQLDCPLVQVSTDYVYETSGQRAPFTELDIPQAPLGVYAKSKFDGEVHARRWEKHFIVRTCGLYSMAENSPVRGRNFVDTMISLGAERDQLSIVNDQFCTPTFVPHLATAIRHLLESKAFGLYHVTNTGATNWFEFAQEIFRLVNREISLTPISTEQFGAASPRPRYSVLETGKYARTTGQPLPDWREALAEYVQSLPGVLC